MKTWLNPYHVLWDYVKETGKLLGQLVPRIFVLALMVLWFVALPLLLLYGAYSMLTEDVTWRSIGSFSVVALYVWMLFWLGAREDKRKKRR
jgi:Na+-driven multidrug efflux pump